MSSNIFQGCVPALMTPSLADRTPNYPTLVKKGQALMAAGMNGVVYCGSMGDWPLLTDEQRQEGVRPLTRQPVKAFGTIWRMGRLLGRIGIILSEVSEVGDGSQMKRLFQNR